MGANELGSLHTVIDIGTNTILVLVARVNKDGTIDILRDEVFYPRLGSDIGRGESNIGKDAIDRACLILSSIKDTLDSENTDSRLIHAVATSAVRNATNQSDVLSAFYEALGCRVQVLSGADEGRLTFLGTTGGRKEMSGVIDIGGGSTEIVIGSLDTINIVASVEVGAVRLQNAWDIGSVPCGLVNLPPTLQSIHHEDPMRFYAVAGTPVSLAMICKGMPTYIAAEIEGTKLTKHEVNHFRESPLSPAELVRRGVEPMRADILCAGVAILDEIMETLKIQQVTVSTRGLRYGILQKHRHESNHISG